MLGLSRASNLGNSYINCLTTVAHLAYCSQVDSALYAFLMLIFDGRIDATGQDLLERHRQHPLKSSQTVVIPEDGPRRSSASLVAVRRVGTGWTGAPYTTRWGRPDDCKRLRPPRRRFSRVDACRPGRRDVEGRIYFDRSERPNTLLEHVNPERWRAVRQ